MRSWSGLRSFARDEIALECAPTAELRGTGLGGRYAFTQLRAVRADCVKESFTELW